MKKAARKYKLLSLAGSCIMAVVLICLPAHAEIYQYTNDEGRILYVENLSDIPSQYRKSSQLELFVTPWCGYCKKLEGFLQSRDVQYLRYDITKNRVARAEFDKLGGNSVPIARIGKQVIYGYYPQKILAALAQ